MGRNKYMCNGRLVFGPDVRPVVFTLLLILIPAVIFCTNVARNLIHEVSAYNAGHWILVVAILLTVYVLVLLFLTSAQDPGIVPPNLHPPEGEIPPAKEVLVNGRVVKMRYCDTCNLYRPPCCRHCLDCDSCVERYDHHCLWIGKCVGKRNYRYFFLFVSSSALLCCFVIVMSALNIKVQRDNHGTWKAIKESVASIILMAYCLLFFLFAGALTFLNIYLIWKNRTTHENCQYGGSDQLRIYDNGCLNNFREAFCPKPGIDFHAYVY